MGLYKVREFMIALIDRFNQVSLHDPSQDINDVYKNVPEINELDNTGRVEGANHIPRGMLEVYLDPNSPIIQNGQVDKNKELIL